VTTAADAVLLHAPDEDHLAFALAAARMIFTQDADFLRFDAAGSRHARIAFCRSESRSIGEIIRMLVLIWEVLDAESVRNHVEYI